MRRVLALVLILTPALARAEREAQPDQHEVDVNLDILVESLANSALIDVAYTFTPGGIDRRDVVPAIVRRFERHPTSFWLRLVHFGGSLEAITSARLGADLNPVDFLYLEGEAGLERDLTLFDAPANGGREYGYYTARLHAGLGFRPSGLLSVGVYYDGRPVIGTDTDDTITSGSQSERSGGEHTFGVTTTFATPGERLYAKLDAFAYFADWTFIHINPGDMTVRGYGADALLSYQATFWTSLQLHGTLTRNHWVDKRGGDDSLGVVGANLDREVLGGLASLDFVYFHQSRYAFRVSLGGGYQQAPPLYNIRGTSIFNLGLGTTIRF